MQKPQGYETAEVREYQGFNSPAPGAYILGIVSAEATQSKSGNDMLVLSLDIADGEFKGHYRRKQEQFGGSKLLKHRRVTSTETSLPYFKGDIKAIEESNNGFKFDFDESKLRGKFVGGMLGEKEFEGRDGEIATTLEVSFLCSVEKVRRGDLAIPKIKRLDGSKTAANYSGHEPVQMTEEDLPF